MIKGFDFYFTALIFTRTGSDSNRHLMMSILHVQFTIGIRLTKITVTLTGIASSFH